MEHSSYTGSWIPIYYFVQGHLPDLQTRRSSKGWPRTCVHPRPCPAKP